MRAPAASLRPGLPPLPEELGALQDAARAEAAVVESGEEPRPAFLGLFTRDPRRLDREERWTRLQGLLASCGRIQSLLESHRDGLRSSFTRLAAQLREVIGGKVGQIRELDAKRMRLLAVGRETHDGELQARSEELGLRLERFLRVLAQGTLLLLGKLEGCRRSLDAQTEDQRRQREALERLGMRVAALREVQAIERELGDAERAAGVAPEMRFDEYRREYFAPLAELLEEVRAVDERLRAAAGEIGGLANALERARPGDNAPFGALEQAAVDSLPRGRALDAAAAEIDVSLAVGDAPAFERALAHIESLVATRLEDCFGEALERASQEGTPQAWRAYLAQYPQSAGAQQAGEALQRLEGESLVAARAETARGAWRAVPAWRSLIERFPVGAAAREARLELARLQAEALAQARSAASPREAFDAWHRLRSLFADRTAEETREADEGYHGALVGLEPTPRHWRDYLAACPQGPLVAEAQAFLDAYAWVPEWAAAWGMDAHPNGRCWVDLEVKAVRQRFRLIEPGVFVMGSPAEELRRKENEGPRHEVTLTRPFWIATTECTQLFWEAVTGTNPSRFQGKDRPVENVSWEDTVLFLKALSGLVPGLEARLPTEAEWEYACRAGTTGPYAGSGLWQEMAWVPENSGGETHPVATRPENAWGLHDMHGNVTEWVSDGLRAYGHESVVDPIGPEPPTTACLRGGCFDWGWDGARSAYRIGVSRALCGPGHGLRIAASASRDVGGWVRAAHLEAYVDGLARPPDHGVFLGDLAPVRVGTAYAPAVNDAWGARSCLVGGRRCGTFVTVHAPTEAEWAIPEDAFEFRAIGARGDRPDTFHGTWSYQILVDGKTVFESSPFYERRGGIPIEVTLPAGARRLTVITEPLGDNQYDWAVLAWPYFRLKPPFERLARIPEGAIFLGDLEPTSAKVGHRELRGFKDAPGQVMPIGGKPCDTFLDIHAPAAVTYAIPEGACRFTAIGSRWDREFTAHGTWRFEVWIAGKRVFDSPALHEKPDGIPIDVAIPPDARELTIRVDDYGDNFCDWSILAYPCFHIIESAAEVAARVGLRPGEVLFRTVAGGWLCAEPGGDGLRVAVDAAEPGSRFRFREVDGSACLFLLEAQGGRFVRLEGERAVLATEADPKKHYLQLVHAAADRFAIHHWGPYLSAATSGLVTPTASGVGPSESFQVVDPHYPPPPAPAPVDLDQLRGEALVSLQFDASRVVEERGDRILIDARGGRSAVLHDGQIVAGRRAGALALDGVRGALELRLPAPLPSAALSIAFWMRYESYERDENRSYWLHQAEAGREAMRLCQYYGRLLWEAGGRAMSRGEFLLGRWHHVAVVVEGLRHRLYVDGVAQVDGTGRFTPASAPLWIGRAASGEPATFCHGLVEDLLVLQRALRPEQVRGLWRWS